MTCPQLWQPKISPHSTSCPLRWSEQFVDYYSGIMCWYIPKCSTLGTPHNVAGTAVCTVMKSMKTCTHSLVHRMLLHQRSVWSEKDVAVGSASPSLCRVGRLRRNSVACKPKSNEEGAWWWTEALAVLLPRRRWMLNSQPERRMKAEGPLTRHCGAWSREPKRLTFLLSGSRLVLRAGGSSQRVWVGSRTSREEMGEWVAGKHLYCLMGAWIKMETYTPGVDVKTERERTFL